MVSVSSAAMALFIIFPPPGLSFCSLAFFFFKKKNDRYKHLKRGFFLWGKKGGKKDLLAFSISKDLLFSIYSVLVDCIA